MNYLFIHQSVPGQFPHLAKDLARDPKNNVYFLTRFGNAELPGVRVVRYGLAEKPKITHDQLQNLQNSVVSGESVAKALLKIEKENDFRPDVIYAHPGWGETLFVKDIFSDVPLIHFAEFYYHTFGADSFATVDEVPEFADHMRLRMKNAVNLLALEICDLAVTPTEWQWRQQPARYREKTSIIHDGIDTDAARPDPQATLQLPDGTKLHFGDEVVTYVNRHLEPFRGMFVFAEAAAIVAQHRPGCRFLIVGAETRKYYGPWPPKGRTYREMAIERLGPARDRCIFLGLLPYADLMRVFQISAAHVYLTRPFVLSWSMLDAMSAGCVVIGAASPPVAEVIRDEENGLLVDPYSPDELAERLLEVLANRNRMKDIAMAARQTVLEKYSLDVCLAAQKELIARAVAGGQAAQFGIPEELTRMTRAGLRRMPPPTIAAGLLTAALCNSAIAAADPPIRLAIPLNCHLNQDCYVQTYFDHDAGEGAQDYTCGSMTYNGHDGTDFRVPDLSSSRDLAVHASAAGRVLRTRDGMPDISVRRTGKAEVEGRECGNGLVIDHGNGWETQYCHLADGSVSVRPGDMVAEGQPIGRVGMSGLSEFPHVHVGVRFQGKLIDPFAFGWTDGSCASGKVIWDLPAGWTYLTDYIINTGFVSNRVVVDDINAGVFARFTFTQDSPALLAVGLAGGISRGSVIEVSLVGPDGQPLAKKSVGPLAQAEAQYVLGVGKRRPAAGWPAGIYRGVFRIVRGTFVTEKRFDVKL